MRYILRCKRAYDLDLISLHDAGIDFAPILTSAVRSLLSGNVPPKYLVASHVSVARKNTQESETKRVSITINDDDVCAMLDSFNDSDTPDSLTFFLKTILRESFYFLPLMGLSEECAANRSQIQGEILATAPDNLKRIKLVRDHKTGKTKMLIDSLHKPKPPETRKSAEPNPLPPSPVKSPPPEVKENVSKPSPIPERKVKPLTLESMDSFFKRNERKVK